MTSSAGGADIPDLVPARMVNEFAYCPRLFYLEWVQGRFVDSDDTVEGRWQHRVVDDAGGAAPLPGGGPFASARSLQLSSPRLGVVAKMDLVEGQGDAVIPVDTKRGSPPDNLERSWEPERIQLCIQGLLLREAGYRCVEGALYFAESRERVTVPFGDELIARTHEVLGHLRHVAAREHAPAPLVDSPKCPRCSLVGLCLPDETNLLVGRGRAPRRLLPSAHAARPLYVTQPGAYIGKKAQRIEVSYERKVISSHRLIDVSQLCLMGNAQLSSQLTRDLLMRDVPICWFTSGGWFAGMATGLASKHVELRRQQVLVADTDRALHLATTVIEGKIRNTRTLLMRNARPRPKAALAQLEVDPCRRTGGYAAMPSPRR
jgi:CRISPR-associated protein Cas1